MQTWERGGGGKRSHAWLKQLRDQAEPGGSLITSIRFYSLSECAMKVPGAKRAPSSMKVTAKF